MSQLSALIPISSITCYNNYITKNKKRKKNNDDQDKYNKLKYKTTNN